MKLLALWCQLLALLFALPASAQQTDVTITLESIFVIDDCDNNSDGDWIVTFSGAHSGAPRDVEFFLFPSADNAANVSNGSTVRVGRSFTLSDVPLSNRISVAMSAVDCDSDGESVPGYFLVPGFPITVEGGVELDRGALPVPNLDCSGEEEIFVETSGNNDDVGSAAVELSPNQWNNGGRFTLTPAHSEQCFEGRIAFEGTVGEPGEPIATDIGEGTIGDPGGSVERAYRAEIEVTPGPVDFGGSLVPILMLPTL